ncbi:retrotransposon gag protein [Penicillium sp. DV-2018c]|nr:retrotransposon gag protein [Penicillium sp. DV-2018c]
MDPQDHQAPPPWLQALMQQMENKLDVDGEAIGSPHDQFMYIFSRLEKLAWKNTGTFVKHRRSEGDPVEILEYLERIYGDPNAQARAARKLHQMKQPDGVSFPRFLPRLEKEFADAGAINWHDQARRQILLGSLNKTMSAALMNRGIPNTYSELVNRLHEISNDIDALTGGENGKKSSARRGRIVDEMDWEPTVSANKVRPRENRNRASNGKRAKWVAEEITRRREQGLCLRCGEEDHFVSNCSYRPAERPSSSRVALGQTKKGHAANVMAKRRDGRKTVETDDYSSGEETPTESESDSENE